MQIIMSGQETLGRPDLPQPVSKGILQPCKTADCQRIA
jgi:hypothetical protein